jgi:hypothetical protein
MTSAGPARRHLTPRRRGGRARRGRSELSVIDQRDGRERVLRVVTLEDGATLHNALFDRSFREQVP